MISVILPVLNAQKYLKSSIKSILDQTFKNFELIICDNGSTDDSHNIIEEFINIDERIVLIYCDQKGIGQALNKAIEIANFPYIARMDADDIAFKDRLQIQFNFMKDNPHIDILGSAAIGFNSINNTYTFLSVPKKHNDCSSFLFSGLSPLIHPSIMAKKEILKKYLYDSKYNGAEDYELFFRMFLNGVTFENISYPLLGYRTENLSHEKYIHITTKAFQKYSGIFNPRKALEITNSFKILQKSYSGKKLKKSEIKFLYNSLRTLIGFKEGHFTAVIIRLSLLLFKSDKKTFLRILKVIAIHIKDFPKDSLTYLIFRLSHLLNSLLYLKFQYPQKRLLN